ncbi:hypothetical protein GCM10008922_25250 [Faecalicatena contorta]|uniref:Uncharacterized protein n=1 Tax=Hungatella hathewayi TaxID=154046 RepID=A0A3E2WET8_9FIRM|nr:hypothetical protein [Hungatella hathewayi]MEE0200791.1 AP2 domain-containing protein [Muricomes sp.]RGC24875.1 hypothetical protein DWX41_20920 [Hungatella hathewayi]
MKEKDVVRIGSKFNRLLVVSEYPKDKYSHKRFLCQCDCGNEVVVLKGQLTSGKTGSCGCYQRDRAREAQLKHGMANTKIYYVWKDIIQRCSNANSKSYSNYGHRGISVCDDWLGTNGFEKFYQWALDNGYREGLEIDRIKNNGNYEPSNCRWATKIQQANNKRNNIVIKHNEKEMTVSQWARELGIDDKKIRQRIQKLGWDNEKSIMVP